MSKTITCECGGRIVRRNAKGHFLPYGEYGMVKLMKDCDVLLCSKCSEAVVEINDFSLDNVLQNSLSGNVEKIVAMIQQKHGLHPGRVAAFLGMTPDILFGYQTELPEQAIPSPAFLELKNILRGGKEYMDSLLQSTWEEDTETPDPTRT